MVHVLTGRFNREIFFIGYVTVKARARKGTALNKLILYDAMKRSVVVKAVFRTFNELSYRFRGSLRVKLYRYFLIVILDFDDRKNIFLFMFGLRCV